MTLIFFANMFCCFATTVIVDIQKGTTSGGSTTPDNTAIPYINAYNSSDSGISLSLKDISNNSTPYTLQIVLTSGKFWDQPVTTVASQEGKPGYYPYFQNEQAMNELTGSFGSEIPWQTTLDQFIAPGASGATTSSIKITGLETGVTVTLYMFVSTVEQKLSTATTVDGGMGEFSYAISTGTGFNNAAQFSEAKHLTLIKWVGTVNNDSLDFHLGGAKAGPAAIFFMVPEPSSVSLLLFTLGCAVFRRRSH